MNPMKLQRAKVKAHEAAKIVADVEKKPMKPVTEEEVKVEYLKLNGLVASDKAELKAKKAEAEQSANDALKARINKIENERRAILRQETMKDGDSDQLAIQAEEIKELQKQLALVLKAQK